MRSKLRGFVRASIIAAAEIDSIHSNQLSSFIHSFIQMSSINKRSSSFSSDIDEILSNAVATVSHVTGTQLDTSLDATLNTICACQSIAPKDASSINCLLCQKVLPCMADAATERKQLMEQLDNFRSALDNEETRYARLERQNNQLLQRVKELEDSHDAREEQLDILRLDMHSLSTKLVGEVEKRAEIQAERDKISEELEELTRSLFEEANGMVKVEAQRRHESEKTQSSLQVQLEVTKVKLQSEKRNVSQLRRKISDIAVASLKTKKSVLDVDELEFEMDDDQASNFTSQSTPLDTFSSLEVEMLADQRSFEEFKLMVDRIRSYPLNKAVSQLPFLKQCVEEHVEPCCRLPKISSRKIMEAFLSGNMRIAKVNHRVPSPPPESSSMVELPAQILTGFVTQTSPTRNTDTDAVRSSSPARAGSSISLRSMQEQLSRAVSPSPRPPSWFSGTNSSLSDPHVCAGCGRQGLCDFQITILSPVTNTTGTDNNTTTPSFSSTLSAKLEIGYAAALHGAWIDSTCRDRFFSIWEFYNFLRRLRRINAPPASSRLEEDAVVSSRRASGADDLEVPLNIGGDLEVPSIATDVVRDKTELYVEYLRLLKQMFYARIGVLGYFMAVEGN